jgi:5'-deoxynucleotidase YfbR-like HD superfamily hydrolase
MPTSKIPLQISSYSTTREYRACLRNMFQMDPSKYRDTLKTYEDALHDDFDDETRDEMSYDEDAAKLVMDAVFDATKRDPLFQTLYDMAAARMFSTDRDIGLAVLFSYDYLSKFHACVVQFTETPEQFSTNSVAYQSMVAALR